MSVSTYDELAAALEERLRIIADRDWYVRDSAGHLAGLIAISEEIDLLAQQLPRPLPGELAHYLERKSYDKALALLNDLLARSS